MLSVSVALPILLLVSGLLAFIVGYFSWREREKVGAGVMALVLVVIGLWGFGQAILLSGTAFTVKRAGFALSMVGYLSIPPLWLLYASQYTGWKRESVRRPLALATAVPIGWSVIVFTNPVHGVLYTDAALQRTGAAAVFSYEWTALYWVVINVSYLLCGVAVWQLGKKFLASRNVYRRRTFFFIVASITLTSCHVLSQYGLSPFPQFTLGPLYFLTVDILSLLAFVSYRGMQFVPVNRMVGLFGFRSKSLAPLAREAVIERMGGAVLVIDHKNRVADINPEAKELLGADRRIVGKPLRDVFPPEKFLSDDPEFLERETTEATYSGVWMEDDEQNRCFDIDISGLRDENGELTGRVALIHDVTDRERRKQKLESKNEQLDKFASVVSHDLRNPLNVAQGSADLVEMKGGQENFNRLQESLTRMERIIDDVLTLAREGQAVTDTSSVSLATSAQRAWEHVDTADATLDVGTDTRFEADEGRLEQLFENLFRNAVEHGGHDVTVTVGSLDTGFFVADNGPGIPEQHREEVLEEGFTTEDSGTGFGLSIVRTIVDAHGWSITVTESQTGGARFEIRTHSETADNGSVVPTV